MRTPILYRDENGNGLTVTEVLRQPGAWHPNGHGSAVLPIPEKSHIIGTIRGRPVILGTDVGGGTWLTEENKPFRTVTFKVPGDGQAYRIHLPFPCTIPLYVSKRGLTRKESWLDRKGFYIVHQVTRETLADLDAPHGGRQHRRLRAWLRKTIGFIAHVGGLVLLASPR